MTEIDHETRHAMDVIVRAILWKLVDADRVGEMWEDFPEIGENDWIEISEQVKERANSFLADPKVHKAAYAHLARRANPA